MNSDLTIDHLNKLPQEEFTRVLADIFEHSSWIPERAWQVRPFKNTDHLHKSMVNIVEHAKLDEKLSLLCAHPQLAGKEAKSGTLTSSSTEEQSAANLNSLDRNEMDEITRLNAFYIERHGFPFIIAVKNHDKPGIFSEFRRRANNAPELEFDTALAQVAMIARFRLDALIEVA
ncbi:MAG: 2-oxo-4-hydroxy-4-carboxy-5-ureidoimidazoline decarboxylase [Arenicella sp.]|jgi:2-oxo-4-hydroxy-4-carboxy-5-ureidoimidazoline decarboxylase